MAGVVGPVPHERLKLVCPEGTPDVPKCLIDHLVANASEGWIAIKDEDGMITDDIQGRPIGTGEIVIRITHHPHVHRYFFPEDLLTWWRKEETDRFINSRDITGDQNQHWFTSPFRKVLGDSVVRNGRYDPGGWIDVSAIKVKFANYGRELAINRKPEKIQNLTYARPSTAGRRRRTRRYRRKSYRKK